MSRRVFLLPGMGADSAMYSGPWRALDSVTILDWPAYQGETTLGAVAERIVAANEIRGGDLVGGSSLGGMVALEIARRIPVRAVVLIGSAVECHEISPFLRLAAPLASVTPLRLAQILAGKSVDGPIAESFSRADPRFIRAMCNAVPAWQGGAPDGIPIHRIHGRRDRVIPCPSRNCRIISDGGHLIAVTHTQECLAFLDEILKGH